MVSVFRLGSHAIEFYWLLWSTRIGLYLLLWPMFNVTIATITLFPPVLESFDSDLYWLRYHHPAQSISGSLRLRIPWVSGLRLSEPINLSLRLFPQHPPLFSRCLFTWSAQINIQLCSCVTTWFTSPFRLFPNSVHPVNWNKAILWVFSPGWDCHTGRC